jgi:cyanophycin synthetase
MQTKCEECGDYPVNHFSARFALSLENFLSTLPSLRPLYQLFDTFAPTFVSIGSKLRILSFNDDVNRVRTDRARVLWEEAQARGINVRQLLFLGSATEFFVATAKDGKDHFFESLPLAAKESAMDWVDDKYRFKEIFNQEHIAVPKSYTVSSLKDAKNILPALGVVCVKPRVGSNGRHTFPYVKTAEELAYAFKSAQKLSRFVVVEEHLEGNLARATCVDGKLVGFLECMYPTVAGDGTSTVRELIDATNSARPRGAEPIEITSVHEKYIARRGYSLGSVLERGKSLTLVYRAGLGSGGRNKEYGVAINPELKKEIERAARVTTLPIVGFDLIIEDPLKGPQEQKWGIIEANSMPWIDLHHRALYNNPQNVAGHIWDVWETTGALGGI